MRQSTELQRFYSGSLRVAMFLPSCSGTVLLKELEMPPTLIPAALLAIALWVTPCFAAAGAKGESVRTAAATEHQIASPDQLQSDNGSDAGSGKWQRSLNATLARARALL